MNLKQLLDMKTFVLSGLIATATIGNNFAHEVHGFYKHDDKDKKEWVEVQKRETNIKEQVAFYQWRINLLWNQYERVIEQVRNSKGNQKELEENRTYFLNVYQQNLQQGVAVEESKKSIARLERQFRKDLVKRRKYELTEIARLRASLKRELLAEERKFEIMKKKNADLTSGKIRRELQHIEDYFAQSKRRIEQAEKDKEISIVADAR